MSSSAQWTFTQGLLVGQASFLVLCLLFIRYVVFSPSEPEDGEAWKRRQEQRAKLSTTGVPPPPPSHLLGKTGYDMASHAAESTDWLNVLFAQGYRNDLLSSGGEEGARQRIESWLNPPGKSMSWMDPIQVTSIKLGSSYPLLSNARIRPADGQGRIRAEVDIDYLDSLSLSVSTSVLVNFPRPRFAVLPVSIGVELVSVGGTMSIQLHDPENERQHVHLCLLPDFHLNMKTTSLLGSRAKLQDIPKLEQLIVTRLRAAVQDRLVHPAHLSVALPRLLTPLETTPIVADIAQSAVGAVGNAVGGALGTAAASVGRIVSDLVDDDDGGVDYRAARPKIERIATAATGTGTERTATGRSSRAEVDTESSAAGRRARGDVPTSPAGKKAITMPAGFLAAAAPPPPHADGHAAGSHVGSKGHVPSAYGGVGAALAPRYAGSASSYRPRGDEESLAPSQSQSQFRFRGQFASPEERRVGALNSRA